MTAAVGSSGRPNAIFGGGDFSTALGERSELYDVVRDSGISGFTVVSGDRHSFWAGYAAKALPPESFDPVGNAFICGSISAPGLTVSNLLGLPPSSSGLWTRLLMAVWLWQRCANV